MSCTQSPSVSVSCPGLSLTLFIHVCLQINRTVEISKCLFCFIATQVLIVCLLYEMNKGKASPWHPYLLYLPRNYAILAAFGEFEKQALQVLSLILAVLLLLSYISCILCFSNLTKYLRWIMLSGLHRKLALKLNMSGNKPLFS